SFAKYGVPALYAKGGIDHAEKGVEFGREVQKQYTAVAYHTAADEFDPEWDLRGVVQDLYALYGVGRELAGNDAWPNYVEGNAFKAARDAARAAAAEASADRRGRFHLASWEGLPWGGPSFLTRLDADSRGSFSVCGLRSWRSWGSPALVVARFLAACWLGGWRRWISWPFAGVCGVAVWCLRCGRESRCRWRVG